MESHRIKRLPVVEDKKLIGIITEADLARHLTDEQVAEFVERVYSRRLRRPAPSPAVRSPGR